MTNTNKNIFNRGELSILERGLAAMTITCDSLTRDKELLTKRVEELEAETLHLRDRLLIDREERE